jgi:C4-dicarboxylate-specific signal transduction histidine kinase
MPRFVGTVVNGWEATTNTQWLAESLSPVSGDRLQLQQVVLNLIMNAIDAMSGVEERARELVITTENSDAERVVVAVKDSGTGLDQNTLEKIFDPFYTTKPGGTGMGFKRVAAAGLAIGKFHGKHYTADELV